MYFKKEQIGKIVSELARIKVKRQIAVEEIMTKKGFYHDIPAVDANEAPWIPMGFDDFWGGVDQYQWFRFNWTVPKALHGERLVHKLFVSRPEPLGGAEHPQMMIYVNGRLRQGLDSNHTETLLTEYANAGETFVVDIQGYGGTYGDKSLCRNYIQVVDKKIECLHFDLLAPYEVISHQTEEDQQRIETIEHLLEAIRLIDFRQVYSSGFYKSIDDALNYMRDVFYGQYCKKDHIVVRGVGHTHIDVAWLWDLDQTRQKVQRSFATVLELMDQYPEYLFMSSQPQLYEFIAQERPELFERIRKRVKEGRWEPEGAMWVEADTNIPSGESLVRQILFGKRYFRENFGIESQILWLPDVFGYSAALPQILDKFGIRYFMTTKISWNEYNKMPADTFKWVGIDGSGVLAHFITTADVDDLPEKFFTTYNGTINASSVMGAWKRYQQKTINDEVLISYGFGDGGGGPTKEMLEIGRRLEKGIPGCPMFKQSTAKAFFEQLHENVADHPKLPSWVGELYFEYHRGTLTSMGKNKWYNRKTEILYGELEFLSTLLSSFCGAGYPSDLLNNGWKTILLNQFHDIIPGSSIKKVYEDSWEQYETILREGSRLKEQVLNKWQELLSGGEAGYLIANTLSFGRGEYVPVSKGLEKVSVYVDDIPPMGVIFISQADMEARLNSHANHSVKVTEKSMENPFFRLQFNDQGELISIYDKRADREIIPFGSVANAFQFFEDKPHNWDAWDINIYYQDKKYQCEGNAAFEVAEEGAIGKLKIVKTFNRSSITQHVTLYGDIDRIDFDTKVDWKEEHILMKVAFPVEVHADEATYDIQFGNIKRPTHWNTSWDAAKFEVCAHQWADLSEDGYGVSLLNDCKYAYDIKGNVIRLTLLKSATYPNPIADKGEHRFVYSLYPHQGDWKEGKTANMAKRLNQPIHVRGVQENSECIQEKSKNNAQAHTLCIVEKDNVFVDAVKQSEDGKGIVLRLHENNHRRTKTSVTFSCPISKVWVCDLEENKRDNVALIGDNCVELTLKPYEIVTLYIEP
ncbi:MAG: alpha-mannosidase [Clostridia bacterium]|nr:alpha-mannosidase [Clostridia bacterium]